MPAELITRFKNITPEGAILELVVWKVPAPVPPTEHGYKYSAVYVVNGVRVVGFDNERGKGDQGKQGGFAHSESPQGVVFASLLLFSDLGLNEQRSATPQRQHSGVRALQV